MSVAIVLESLQTQIHSKTSVLPSLYSQLGLPPSALTDELTSLQLKLTECVDEVVTGRKKEVDEWMNRCRILEKQVNALLKSLGMNDQESANITILPARCEALTAHCQKLQKMYASRLDQINSLRNRLANYTRIFGEDFISCPQQSTPSEGDQGREDVSSEVSSKLEKDVLRCKNEVTRRIAALSESFDHLSWLHTELGIPIPGSDPFLDPNTTISSTSEPTVSTSDPDTLFNNIFAAFANRSNVALDGVEPSNSLIAWTESKKEEFEALKAQREKQIQQMYDQLELLWKRLAIEEEEIDDFVESWRGSTDAVIEAYEIELERMMELKRSAMSTFIGNARLEIEGLWDDIMLGDDERAGFFPFFEDDHTEDLLALHEQEIARLKEEKRTKARLLTAIKKYSEICDEEKELAAAASDQTRLLGRGPRDPGRLLREEKMRKRVTKEKPRLELDLLSSVGSWEAEHGKPFLVNGINFLEALHEGMGKGSAEKENKKRPRPNNVPTHQTMARTTTPAVGGGHGRPTPGQGSSSKRPRLDAPTPMAQQQQHHYAAVRASSATPTPAAAYYGSTNRQVLNNHNPTKGLLGMMTPGYPGSSMKTPSTMSSLPRAKSAYNAALPPPPLPVPAQYSKIGMGMPTALATKNRVASATSSVTSSSRSVSYQIQGVRRESFRPRASIDHASGLGEVKRVATAGTAERVVEEEEYQY